MIIGRVLARVDSATTTPVERAQISLIGTSALTITAADGRFAFARASVGQQTLRVRVFGYRTTDHTIAVVADDTARVEIELGEREAIRLLPIRAEAAAEDITAFLSRPNVATVGITAAAMEGVPRVGEPDVVRVVQLLPGVVSRNDYNTGLNVRGGEADQNLILLDGHPIYNPFHLGGLFSTFMDATVGGIELMSGAFPARYGGRLSSVLDVRSGQESESGINGNVDVSVLGASVKLGGLVSDGRGSWSVAGRRTYADAAASVFTDNIFPYHFRDFHGRATYALPGGINAAVTAYLGRDVLDANLAEFDTDSVPSRATAGAWAFNWGNRVLGTTLSKEFARELRIPGVGWRIADQLAVEQRFGYSGFSTVLDLGDGAFTQRNSLRDVRACGSVVARTEGHDRSIGYELASYRVRYGAGSAETGTNEYDFTQTPASGALWLDDLWRVSSRFLIQGGVRAEMLRGRGWSGISPRLSLKYFASQRLAITAGAGQVTQWLHSLAGDGALRYFDVWVASDSFIPVAKAWHGVTGAERRFDWGTVKLEGYFKGYDRLMEANLSEDPQRRGDEFYVARGGSYGVDLLARRQPPPSARGWGGWVSYTYGLSWRERDGARWFPGHDRRHDLDVVGTWRLSRYQLGARFGYATGSPYTPIVGQIARRVYDPSLDRWGTGEPRIFIESLGGPRNSERFPPNHRLDVDASREFQYRGALVAPYLSVANVYNAQNVFVYQYEYSTDVPTRHAISQFPVLPSVGVRVAF